MMELKNLPSKEKSLYNTKSIIYPNIQFAWTSIKWYRQPSFPYQLQQLPQYSDQKKFYCSNLDLYCKIKCRFFQDNLFVNEQIFGPVQPFLYTKINSQIELKVNINLFNIYKKCLLYVSPTPVLVNPLNGAKYQFTAQDIKSIFLKFSNQEKTYKEQVKINFSSSNKNVIVVGNLFQRLILLKLFHQIPKGMYCYSMEIVQITFFDENACNLALQAINQIKYPNKKNQKREFKVNNFNFNGQNNKSSFIEDIQSSQDNLSPNGFSIGKSIIAQKKDNGQANYFFMKNENLSQKQLQTKNNILIKQLLNDQNSRSPKSSLTIKTPKESLISNNESITSKSSLARQSKQSLYNNSQNKDQNNSSKCIKLSPPSKNGYSTQSIKSPKAPKISILSTDMASIRQKRQQKQSFPDVPPTNNLKSSQLIKSIQKKNDLLSLRRSQDEIKTPRSQQDKKEVKKVKQQNLYVDEFENLLFNKEKNDQNQICLNDSFQKMQKQEEKVIEAKSLLKQKQRQEWDQVRNIIQNMIKQNKTLKQKNFQIVQEICQIKNKKSKSNLNQKNQKELQLLKSEFAKLQSQVSVLKAIKKSVKYPQNMKTISFRNSNYTKNQKNSQQACLNSKICQPSNLYLNRNSEGFPIKQSTKVILNQQAKNYNLKVYERSNQGFSYKYPQKIEKGEKKLQQK